MIQINPSGQALVIYLDQKMHSSLVINALGLNRPWASSLFYIKEKIKFNFLVNIININKGTVSCLSVCLLCVMITQVLFQTFNTRGKQQPMQSPTFV